jgi:hypothetical protein
MRLGVSVGHVSIMRIHESHECTGIVSKYVLVNKGILIDREFQQDREVDRLLLLLLAFDLLSKKSHPSRWYELSYKVSVRCQNILAPRTTCSADHLN